MRLFRQSGEGNKTRAGAQGPCDLAEDAGKVVQVMQCHGAEGTGEGIVGKGQGFGLAADPFDAWLFGAGAAQHQGRLIEADRHYVPVGNRDGVVAGAAADIENRFRMAHAQEIGDGLGKIGIGAARAVIADADAVVDGVRRFGSVDHESSSPIMARVNGADASARSRVMEK